MAASRQTVEQTLADAIGWRPVLEPVLRAFEPLLAAQAQLTNELARNLRRAGTSLPEQSTARAEQGVSLLAGEKLTGLAAPLRASAEKLLPLLGAMEALTPHMPALKAFFLLPEEKNTAEPTSGPDNPKKGKARAKNEMEPENGSRESTDNPERSANSPEALAEALISGNREAVTRIAKSNRLDPPVLEFVSGFVVSPVLRALVAQSLSGDEQPSWDVDGRWQKGYCPVCGALPVVSWLDKPAIDDKNAFLAGGGGKKHLYCGMCSANWTYRRGVCPSCEQEGNGVIEILRESDNAHGERLDWCTKCKSYCPTVDLREREFVPDLNAVAMGMMHLDMVAARKKLHPLKPSFWNMF